MLKKALLIGINYIGTSSQLNGCINDVENTRQYLINHRGYLNENIAIMTDETPIKPTRDNMLSAMSTLFFSDATVLYLGYSGHGSHVPDENGDEANHRDEALIPLDYQTSGPIIDDDIRAMVTLIHSSKRLTVVLDCCHSGTGVDLAFNAWKRSNNYILVRDNKYQPTRAHVIMLSGCSDAQTSTDAYIDDKYQGALTASYLQALTSGKVNTYEDLIVAVKAILRKNKFSQTPNLSSGKPLNLKSSLDI